MDIILASNSPRRKEILESLGYKFRIAPADIDENIDLTGERLVCELAKRKALRIYNYNKDSIVIGSDTIVYYNGKVYNKPKSEEECYFMLKSLSGKTHEVITGVYIANPFEPISFFEKAYVTFRELTDEEIYNYIKTKEPFDKAGGYAIQGVGNSLVESYKGDLYTIIGLPKDLVNSHLKRLLNR
ncbi:MAG: septum formation protein Maf [Acholeplasmatales bacterium]|nr:septum formation protein Maf [Acholeplasmatales bacterium]